MTSCKRSQISISITLKPQNNLQINFINWTQLNKINQMRWITLIISPKISYLNFFRFKNICKLPLVFPTLKPIGKEFGRLLWQAHFPFLNFLSVRENPRHPALRILPAVSAYNLKTWWLVKVLIHKAAKRVRTKGNKSGKSSRHAWKFCID